MIAITDYRLITVMSAPYENVCRGPFCRSPVTKLPVKDGGITEPRNGRGQLSVVSVRYGESRAESTREQCCQTGIFCIFLAYILFFEEHLAYEICQKKLAYFWHIFQFIGNSENSFRKSKISVK